MVLVYRWLGSDKSSILGYMSEKIRIAVTGVGGGVGQSIIKALADTDYEVVALDGEPLGTGLYAAAASYVIPYANKPDFIDRLLNICKTERCALLFPGLDAELPVLAEAANRFKEIGTTVVVSSPQVIDLSDNKLKTYQQLTKLGFTVPKTVNMATHQNPAPPLAYPFILKKRVGGHRSLEVYLVRNDKEYENLQTQGVDLKLFIAQEYIEGDEYTCGTINLNNACMGVIVMRRGLRDGDTYKAFAIKDSAIEKEVSKLATAIKPFGACNIQLRVKNGVVYVLEINARCSGTTAARALCGFNEPKMIADYICKSIKPVYDVKEQTILRYWKELVVPNNKVDKLRKTGQLKQDNFERL